jgi:hypothetical protein
MIRLDLQQRLSRLQTERQTEQQTELQTESQTEIQTEIQTELQTAHMFGKTSSKKAALCPDIQ